MKKTTGRRQTAEQRDADQNYGGDTRKRADMQQFDKGLPATRVYANMGEEASKLYAANKGTPREVKFAGIRISLARMVESGEIKASGPVDEKGQVPVNVDAALLNRAIDMVLSYRASQPVTFAEAMEEFGRVLGERSTFAFLKANNRGVDFAAVDALVAQARTIAESIPKDGDFRPAVQLLPEIEALMHATVNEAQEVRLRRTAATVGAGEWAEAEIAKAAQLTDPNKRRNALLESFKFAVNVKGANDPARPQRTQNTGNRFGGQARMTQGRPQAQRKHFVR